MDASQETQSPDNSLRRQAEQAMQGGQVDLTGLHPEDVQSLLHELQVYQVELRMQNDELRRVQLELETSRDRFSDLYNFAPTGYCTLDRKGVILETNQTLADMLDAPPNILINVPITHFVEAKDQDEIYLHIRRAFKNTGHHVSEAHMHRQTGEPIAVRLESVIDPNDQGRLMVALIDVTERKRMEEALAQTRDRLQIVLENAPLDLYTTDRELRYTWTFSGVYGLLPEAVLGKRDDQLFPGPALIEVTALKRLVLEDGVGRRGEVHFILGRVLHVQDMVVKPLRGEGGEVVGLTVAAVDVTERKRMETADLENASLRQVQHRLLDQREQERQQIAHDLHDGPVQELTGITFSLRTLLMRESSSQGIGREERDQELEAIQATLQELIHELRTYAGELRPPTLTRFGLEQAIRSHAETTQENHPSLRILLQLHHTGEKLPENIELSLFRIYQQALNNSIKHAQADQVVVYLENGDHQVRIEIRDNGRGFQLPEDWLSLAQHGHLGLLGMRERAEAVGGKLAVLTAPGAGTSVIVTVPLDDSPAGNTPE